MKPNAHQIALLDRVTQARLAERNARTVALAELEQLIAARTALAQSSTDEAIRACKDAGLPNSRIGLALGTKAAITYNARIARATEGMTLNAEPTAAPEVTLSYADDAETELVSATLTMMNFRSPYNGETLDGVWTIGIDPVKNGMTIPMKLTGTDDALTALKLFADYVQPLIGPTTETDW